MEYNFAAGDRLPETVATNHKWGDIRINNELQDYRPSQIEYREDGLYLIGIPTGDNNWLSGLVGTNGTELVTRHDNPWTVEAEIKLPQGPGLLPAFWGRPAYRRNGEPGVLPEIDVMEAPMSPDSAVSGIHTRIADDDVTVLENLRKIECPYTVGDLSDWITYGCSYDLERYYFTANGEVTHNVKVPLDHRERDWYWILNLAIGGSYPGDPTDETPVPVEMGIRRLSIENGRRETGNPNQDVINDLRAIELELCNCVSATIQRKIDRLG